MTNTNETNDWNVDIGFKTDGPSGVIVSNYKLLDGFDQFIFIVWYPMTFNSYLKDVNANSPDLCLCVSVGLLFRTLDIDSVASIRWGDLEYVV